MSLSKDEKEVLKAWRLHPGYVVFTKLVDEKLSKLTQELMEKVNLEDASHLKTLRDNQIYMRALKDAVRTIETNTSSVYTPSSGS